MNLVRIQFGHIWLDNLYIRLVRSGREDDPRFIDTEFDGTAYLTRMTLQGDGNTSQPCQGVRAASRVLIEGVYTILCAGSWCMIQGEVVIRLIRKIS
jgi:hypothetical protein